MICLPGDNLIKYCRVVKRWSSIDQGLFCFFSPLSFSFCHPGFSVCSSAADFSLQLGLKLFQCQKEILDGCWMQNSQSHRKIFFYGASQLCSVSGKEDRSRSRTCQNAILWGGVFRCLTVHFYILLMLQLDRERTTLARLGPWCHCFFSLFSSACGCHSGRLLSVPCIAYYYKYHILWE